MCHDITIIENIKVGLVPGQYQICYLFCLHCRAGYVILQPLLNWSTKKATLKLGLAC